MIILDTNVISALMRPEPDEVVIGWLNKFEVKQLYTTSISIMEIKYGLALLPEGKKKARLESAFDTMLDDHFQGRILDFDLQSALIAAQIASGYKHCGLNVDIRDIQIAAITKSIGAALATRNQKDFEESGIMVLDPWV